MVSAKRGFCLFAALAAVGAVLTFSRIPGSAADLELGKKVYASACLECHGAEGHGDGPKAKKLGFHPRKFTLGAFKCRCTESGSLPTDEDLYRVVTRGMSGTPMQPHEKTLSEAERRAVVEYIKTLTPRFASEPSPQCIKLPAAVQATEENVAEGKQVYFVLNCWKCHGKTGKGDGPAAKDLKDDWGDPVRAYNFTVMKRFKCGGDDLDIYRTLHTGMNGSPMPSYAAAFLFPRESASAMSAFRGVLNDSEIKELQEYLSKQPGAAEIQGMTSQAQSALVERRTWALVGYLKSLVAP